MFYSSIQQWGPGAKPQQGTWGTESPEAGAFFKSTQSEIKGQVEMKGIIWCHWWRFLLQCTPGLCCFSVMLHNVWHLGGRAWPPCPPPLNPPLRKWNLMIRYCIPNGLGYYSMCRLHASLLYLECTDMEQCAIRCLFAVRQRAARKTRLPRRGYPKR